MCLDRDETKASAPADRSRITHVAPMYNPGYSSGSVQFLAELEATGVGVGLGASQLAQFEGRSGRGST
jgi:hypothetical protein